MANYYSARGRNGLYTIQLSPHNEPISIPGKVNVAIIEAVLPVKNHFELEQMVNGGQIRRRLKELFDDPANRNKEIWLADVHSTLFSYTKGMLLDSLKLWEKNPIADNPSTEKHRRILSWMERKLLPSIWGAGRSAYLALSTEEYIAKRVRRAQRFDEKPHIFIHMDSRHAALVDYLGNSSEARKFLLRRKGRFKRNFKKVGEIYRCSYVPDLKMWKVEPHKFTPFSE